MRLVNRLMRLVIITAAVRLVKSITESKAKASKSVKIFLLAVAIMGLMIILEVVRSVVLFAVAMGLMVILEVMRTMINLSVALRLANRLMGLVNRLVTIAASVGLVRLVNKILLAVAVNKVRFLGLVAFDVSLLWHGLIRHALLAGLAAAARLLAGFALAAAGRVIMRVVSVETTFVEASVLGLVLIEAAATGLVGVEAAAVGSVLFEAAALRFVIVVAAVLGSVLIVATVRVGSVGIPNRVFNVN